MTAWFTTAEGDDLDDTLERAAHQALMEFCECLAAIGDPEHETYHTGWVFTARYTQHVSSLHKEATVTSAYAWRSTTTRCRNRTALSRTSRRATESSSNRTTVLRHVSRS
jgi:hypothetical protein